MSTDLKRRRGFTGMWERISVRRSSLPPIASAADGEFVIIAGVDMGR